MAARGFLGAGDLYIARFVSGVVQPFTGPFECTKFAIKPNVEVKEQVSKGKTTYGQVVETVAVPQPAELTVDLAEVNDTSLAIALFGTTGALAQSSGTMTDHALNAVVRDVWIQLPFANLTGAPVLTTAPAGTTYVLGVDYLVNATLGWVKILSTGAIAAGANLLFDSAYLAIAGTEIRGQTQTQVRARFKLDGKNFADDLPVIVTVHEAVIAADSEFDFLADDFNTVSLPGRMKTPAGFNEPFTVHLRSA